MARLFSSWGGGRGNSSPTPSVVQRVRGGESNSCPSSPVRPRSQSVDHNTGNHNHHNNNNNNNNAHTNPQSAADATTRRQRLNSRDIPRTYSGLYGLTDDLLPFELSRHGGGAALGPVSLVGLYVTVILVVQLLVALTLLGIPIVVNRDWVVSAYSWTVSHGIHATLTILYIHWLKGSLTDDAGEMRHMTIWEQLEATADTRALREALMVVPCLLTWIACHAADYQATVVTVNVALWAVSLFPKLPFMNGVRLFGINATAGIDDETNATSSTSSTPKATSASPKRKAR